MALAELGETRSRQSGVVAAFGQLLIRPGLLDATSGRLLRSLFDRRAGADCDEADEPTSDDAQGAISDAAFVVETVDRCRSGDPQPVGDAMAMDHDPVGKATEATQRFCELRVPAELRDEVGLEVVASGTSLTACSGADRRTGLHIGAVTPSAART